MKIAITSQNLNPKIVVSGISTVAKIIIDLSKHEHFLYEVGYRDGDKKNIKWLIKQIYLIVRFPAFLKTKNIELVHINIPFDTFGILRDSIFLTLSKLFNKKVLLHIHGGKLLMIRSNKLFLRILINYILKTSDKVLVLSDIETQTLLKNYGFTNADYLENAVDTTSISFKQYLPIADKRYKKNTLLYLARITESKGIDDIVVALKHLYSVADFRFILCGSGSESKKYVKIFNDLMGDDFVYKGVVSGDDKWNTIKESDIFLLPSRHSEGLPMSLLETMAAGLIPVVTNEASIAKLVKNGYNGLVVEKYDGENLAKKLYNLFQTQSDLRQFSLAARNTIAENYDTRVYIEKIDLLYNSMRNNTKI